MGSIPLCVWEWSSLEIWKGAQIVLGSMQLQPHRFFKKKNLLYDSLYIKLINRANAVSATKCTKPAQNVHIY